MVVDPDALTKELERLYAASDDVDFHAFITQNGVEDDDELADLIEYDGWIRLQKNIPVDLARYLACIPDLQANRVALDAGIEFALRSLCERVDRKTAIETMLEQHPELERPIRDAAALGEAMWSTKGLHENSAPVRLTLPTEIGPEIPDGRRRYELRRLIGHGAQGSVYAGVDHRLSDEERPAWVAVKILNTDSDPELRSYREEEAKKARRIEHPNVVRVLDIDSMEDDRIFIVSELVEGGNLQTLIEGRAGVISPREAARTMSTIARGAQAVHSAGVIHCDLKPANVLLTREDDPKVADFGIAVRVGPDRSHRENRRPTSYPAGNLAFMSPEQVRPGVAVTASSDVYALGGILYYMLTRRLPNGEMAQEVIDRHMGRLDTKVPSVREHQPSIDEDLDAICRRALESDPKDRYLSADALANDLDAWLRYEPISWNHPSLTRRSRLFARRQPFVAGLSLLTVVLLVFGTGLIVHLQNASTLAKQKIAHGAEIERQELEHEAQQEQDRIRIAELEKSNEVHARYLRYTGSMLAEIRSGGVHANWMAAYTAIEQLMGRTLLMNPDLRGGIVSNRITYVEQMLRRAQRNGRAEDIDMLMWQSCLAFWYLQRGEGNDYDKGLTTLHSNRQSLELILQPGDLWLVYLDFIEAGGIVRSILHHADPDVELDEATMARLREHEETLASEGEIFRDVNFGDPLHWFVLETLIAMYNGPLRDHGRFNQIMARLKEIEQVRETSRVPEPPPESDDSD